MTMVTEKTPTDILAMVEAREEAMAPLFTRMDEDRDMYYLADYVMKDKAGVAVDDIINVTGAQIALVKALPGTALPRCQGL
ncbi:hypothetical protein LCGC14_2719520 [marine sediment metagenome]|uniref:Uncharacterized protein n=1 Tax=marine sediment metagenome TaxID=412755 RepID=A0A0F8ZAD4_9ZZZZ